MERICKRCLLSELNDKDLATHIQEHIASLPEEIKASATVASQRLGHCRTCDNLIDAMCRLCGCYVEVRAAKKQQYCPHPVPLW